VGTTVLTGWTFDVDVLKSAGHSITMKPNAAIGLIACGVSLLCGALASGIRRYIALASAFLAGLIGALTFSEHVVGWNLGIDELFFHEAPGAASTASPGRMGPNASLSLTLASIALISLQRNTDAAARRAQTLAFVIAGFTAIALVGYLYGAHILYSATRVTGIAWPTAVTLLLIAIGIIAARIETGPASVLISKGPGGIMARRILLPAVLLPVTLGYVRKFGEALQFYDPGLGGALLAVTVSMVLSLAVWRAARTLDDANSEREAAQLQRDELLVRERTAREEAEHASRLKDEFLATLSHELRTPLNAIIGWAEMLRTAPLDDERRHRALEVIGRNGRTLVTLVEDLLDVSRIMTGRLRLNRQELDFVSLTASVVDSLAAQAQAKNIELTSALGEEPLWVSGDPERLQQALTNLVANALKFTPSGGSVRVESCATESKIELTIRDTGQGIAASFLPHVFEPFRQQDATTTREHSGLGLGLSIVRDLVELHGGTVTAASPGVGCGSTFTLVLPLAQTQGSSVPAA
jgi:signal transduction histidine kinase